MKKNVVKFLLLLSLMHLFYTIDLAKTAFVSSPIIDLIGNVANSFYPNLNVSTSYDSIPLCGGGTNPFIACPRIHQLLFNETVEILEEKGEEVKIAIPNLFYSTASSQTPHNTYWTQKKHLVSFDELEAHQAHQDYIPPGCNFLSKEKKYDTSNVITLFMPFYDPITKKTYSAGTRFIQVATTQKNDSLGSVFAFDTNSFSFKKIKLPAHLCMLSIPTNKQEKVKAFVNILKRWAHLKDGFIPYVWGGSSFTQTYNAPFHEVITQQQNATKTSYFTFNTTKNSVKNGFDCAGIISRAAQMCWIPYFFKNTTTLAANLKEIQSKELIEAGDLIWIPGHVRSPASMSSFD